LLYAEQHTRENKNFPFLLGVDSAVDKRLRHNNRMEQACDYNYMPLVRSARLASTDENKTTGAFRCTHIQEIVYHNGGT
jgi:hypothetical protein